MAKQQVTFTSLLNFPRQQKKNNAQLQKKALFDALLRHARARSVDDLREKRIRLNFGALKIFVQWLEIEKKGLTL